MKLIEMPKKNAVEFAKYWLYLWVQLGYGWPEDDWVQISTNWDLNFYTVYFPGEVLKCAALYPVEDGSTETAEGFPIDLSYLP